MRRIRHNLRAVSIAASGALSALALIGAIGYSAASRPAEAQYGDLPPPPPPAATAAPSPEASSSPVVGTPVLQAPVSPSQGGTAQSSDGKISITAPPGALSVPATISVSPVSGNVSATTPPPPGNIIIGGQVYEITATANDGSAVTTFQEPIQIMFKVDPAQLAGVNPDDLFVYTYNPGAGRWEPLPTSVDTATGQVTALTPHLSRFAVMKAKFYEVHLAPGANQLAFTGPSGTPLTQAFKGSLDRMDIVWRFDAASNQWQYNMPSAPALSTFSSLKQFDAVYAILRGGLPAILRMIAP